MRHRLSYLCLAILFSFTAHAAAGAASPGAPLPEPLPEPIGKIKEPVSQLHIRFPEEIVKEAKKEAFKVSCLPAREGFSGWADNNTMWTYDFKSKNDSPRLVGGAKCDVQQIADVRSSAGTVWKAGTIHYSVIISGPNVTSVTPAHGFADSLRETDPVILITFDGPVDPVRFFADQNGSLNYLSSNAPSEKLPLAPVPQEQLEKIFEHFKMTGYFDVRFADRNWILATVKQPLISGSQVNLTVQNQVSADNPDVHAETKFEKAFSVRSQFQAEVHCADPSAKTGSCLPNSPISISLNGQVKWADLKNAYIEYIPFKSKDHKTVRSFAEIESDRKVGFWDNILNRLGNYFPFLAKYSDTIVDSAIFNVNIEPQTQAKIVLPAGLKDIDGRLLSNVIAEFHVRIGSMSELIRVPQDISFFEKNVPGLHLPVGIVNLHQTLSIRKSGTDAKRWEPIRDVAAMIQLFRAYAARGTYRKSANYVSPLEQSSVPSTVVTQVMTGAKNRTTVLQFPFANKATPPTSGLYAIEVSSPTFEAARSDVSEGRFYNPDYVLAQVTDLTVHLKKGASSHVAWVTHLSSAEPVAGAQVEIYNCVGQKVAALTTGSDGLVSFPNQVWAKDCRLKGEGEEPESSYDQASQFFIAARQGDDVAVIHSSWTSPNSYALGAPGIEWFESQLRENETHIHAVIGVNLVKPGQQVPVELIAKLPNSGGFSEAPAQALPKSVRVVSSDDQAVYYEFPLKWVNGKAEFVWQVPADNSARLGRYEIEYKKDGEFTVVTSGDIEVAEFKVPLMTGIIALPSDDLIRPDSIVANTNIRYANGVGAKKLAADISYYFVPTSITSKELRGFSFGTGPESATADDSTKPGTEASALPSNTRPAVIQGLSTGNDGSLQKDIAKELVTDGRSVAEVLKTAGRPQRLVVRVRYQDQVGEYQTLSQAKDIFNSASYVGTHLVSGKRQDAKLQAAVINAAGKNITALSDLEFKVIRIETRVIGEELFGGLIKNTLERELKPVRWTPNCRLEDGVAACPVGALKEGSYAFQATYKTSAQAAHSLFKVDSEGRIYGQQDYYNFGDDEGSKQLPLALDKKMYKDHERAVVSFASPFKTCRALVTIERSDVMQAFIAKDACEKGHVEVPVDATFAPNAFVSVYAITGRAESSALKLGDLDLGRPTYRLGYANMKVNWSRFKANVTVKTEKEKYEPGQMVNVAVNVLPEEGQLRGATVTLIAIEEKILELKKNTTYDILQSLMQLRDHSVTTVTALERVETVTADNSDLPGSSDRKGGDEGGDGSSKSDFKRKLFNALVSFQPNVPVVNGVAKFSFKTNDSLTRFKIFAVVTDAAQKFGMGDAVYLTEKETQAYANTPAVAHAGDSHPLHVTIQNNSGKGATFKAEIVATAKGADGKVLGVKTLTKSTKIESASSQAINLGVYDVPEDAAQVTYVIRIYDENGKLVDVIEPEAQTVLAAVPLVVHDSLVAQIENGSLAKTLVKDPEALQGKGELRISAAKSLVSSALTQIGQRFEQNPFADFFIEARFNRAVLRSTQAKPEELKKVLETLLAYTDANGFLKYYPQADRGSVFLTASILNSLRQEPWALKLMPAALSEQLKGAVSQVLTKSVKPIYIGKSPMDWLRAQVDMAQAAFAFNDEILTSAAKALDTTITAELARNPAAYGPRVEKWTNRELVERWLLEVDANPSGAQNSSVLKQLLSPARLVYTGNMAQLSGSPSYSVFYSDETLETAKLLAGTARSKGDKGLAKALAVGLVAANVKGWYNTSTMANVAEGLKGFGRAYEADAVTGTALISVPEQSHTSTVDFDKTSSGSVALKWTEPKANVQVTHSGKGQPWVSIQALSAVPLTAPRGQGLSIEKLVRNVTRDSGYQAGDIIEVTLNVHANANIRHVALLDPIPAGSNILSDAYGEFSSGQKSYSGYKLYFEFLAEGVTTVKFQYQLNNPGTFKMPPTRAEGLYMPSVFAESPNATMKVL